MAELLSDNGRLICLEFPSYKDPSSGGPPWGLSPEVYEQLFLRPGDLIKYDDKGYVIKDESRMASSTALTRIAHWQPERTHEVGKGTDWVSIWRH
jgi:hypothetical protein